MFLLILLVKNNYGNYLSLIRERNKELLYSMDTETNTFPKELLR